MTAPKLAGDEAVVGLVDAGEADVGTGPEVDKASPHLLPDGVLAHFVVDVHKLVAFPAEPGPGYRHGLSCVGVPVKKQENA